MQPFRKSPFIDRFRGTIYQSDLDWPERKMVMKVQRADCNATEFLLSIPPHKCVTKPKRTYSRPVKGFKSARDHTHDQLDVKATL